MKIWVVVLKVFAYVWLTAAALLILAGIIGTWMKGGFPFLIASASLFRGCLPLRQYRNLTLPLITQN